jgi:hypothetical protein
MGTPFSLFEISVLARIGMGHRFRPDKKEHDSNFGVPNGKGGSHAFSIRSVLHTQSGLFVPENRGKEVLPVIPALDSFG